MIELSIITAFLTSMISLIIFRPFAIKFNLVDYPTERKKHIGNIPFIGGICVFLGLLISYLFFIEFDKFSSILLITASLILFLFYLFIIILKRKLRDINESNLRQKMV